MTLHRNASAVHSLSHSAHISFSFTAAVRYYAYCAFYYFVLFFFPRKACALTF